MFARARKLPGKKGAVQAKGQVRVASPQGSQTCTPLESRGVASRLRGTLLLWVRLVGMALGYQLDMAPSLRPSGHTGQGPGMPDCFLQGSHRPLWVLSPISLSGGPHLAHMGSHTTHTIHRTHSPHTGHTTHRTHR